MHDPTARCAAPRHGPISRAENRPRRRQTALSQRDEPSVAACHREGRMWKERGHCRGHRPAQAWRPVTRWSGASAPRMTSTPIIDAATLPLKVDPGLTVRRPHKAVVIHTSQPAPEGRGHSRINTSSKISVNKNAAAIGLSRSWPPRSAVLKWPDLVPHTTPLGKMPQKSFKIAH
jgi:hypothetical protein